MTEDTDDWNANRPVSRIFRNIMLISRFYNGVIDETAREFNLAPGEFLVLMTLMRVGNEHGVRPTDLYNELLVTSGAISKRLDKLEEVRCVERIPDKKDGRAAVVRLTAKGRKIGDAVRAKRTRMYDAADIVGDEVIENMDKNLSLYLAAIKKL